MWSKLKGRGIRELLAQLQVVQDKPVAVGGKVGADQAANRAPVYAPLGNNAQRAQRGVNPVEVAAPVRGQKAVGQADLVDGEPGVALQVYLKVTVRAGHFFAAVHADSGHPFL